MTILLSGEGLKATFPGLICPVGIGLGLTSGRLSEEFRVGGGELFLSRTIPLQMFGKY